MMRVRAGVLALSVLSACSPKVVDLAVNVVGTVCDPDLDPFAGVTTIEVRITGPDLDPPLISRNGIADGHVQVPDIPAGVKRQIEVRGLTDSSPKPISIGRSLPFDIPDVLTASNSRIELNVFMRKVDSFTPPSSVANPQDCSRMRVARAGHTATLLPDGRVYIAGGFQIDSGASTALDATEFYDPQKGTFEDGPRLVLISGIGLPRAFHTATLLKNGQVLIYGGETYKMPSNHPSASPIAIVFDVDKGVYGVVPAREPSSTARTRHLALMEGNGKVLIIGGANSDPLVPVNEVEWYDPGLAKVFLMPGESMPRLGASGAVVQDGGIVVVAGGTDQTGQLNDAVNFYRWDDAGFVRAGATQHLLHPRRAAAAMTLADNKTVIVMGGYKDPAAILPEASSEAIKTGTNTIEETTATIGDRGDACAALLAQGSVLATGGRKAGPMSDGSATLIRYDTTQSTVTAVAAAPLKAPRYFHTCTTMSDGSVLVTGGLKDDQTVLGDAFIYTPIPGD